MQKIIDEFKKLYKTGAFHITAGTFATKFVAFFGSIFVIRILSKYDYGIVGYVENIYSYAYLLAGFGLCYAALRYIIKADDTKKRLYYDYVVKHSFFRDLIIAGTIICTNFFIAFPGNYKSAKYLVPVVAPVVIFQDLISNNLYSLRALFKNIEYAYLSFVVSVSLIIGRIVGAYMMQATGVIWSRLIVNLLLSIFIYFYVRKQFKSRNEIELTKDEIKEMNIYSIQYMLTNGLWAVFMLNDTFILGTFTNNPTILADFKVAYVLPGNLSIFATAVGTYIGPYFTKHEDDRNWICKYFWKTIVVSAGIVGVVSAILFIFASPIIILIYGESYSNIVPLMRMLLVALFINSGIRYVIANLLSSMGKIKYNMIISFVGMLLSIVLDIVLIGKYQAMGVAYSSIIAYSFMSIALLVVFYRLYLSN